MPKESPPDTESETVKVLLDLLRRVDKEVKSTTELDQKALDAIARYKSLSAELAEGRLAADDTFRTREVWTPRTGNRST
ncbi:MAG: hypothetical protein QM756_34985 [Polyangiaceae bacterium]